ncbi:MAG: hypothetical protein IT438_11830 [Phycisphaerales bacterium]|nr:hypothetical protein [Phycisphaerales bacterium]
MSPHSPLAVPTVGEIARRLEREVHEVQYVIRTRGIKPEARAGNLRIFSEAAVARIASELRRIDAEREGPHGL